MPAGRPGRRTAGTSPTSSGDPAIRPTVVYPYAMYGQVDVGFRSAAQAQLQLRAITRNRYGANTMYSLFGIALATSGHRLVALAPLERAPIGTGTVAELDGETGGYAMTLAQPATSTGGLGYTVAAIGPLLLGTLHSVTGGWAFPLVLLAVLAGVQGVVGLGAGRDVIWTPGAE